MSFINGLFIRSGCSLKDVVCEIANSLDRLAIRIALAAERYFSCSHFDHSTNHYITLVKEDLRNLHQIIIHDDAIMGEATSSNTLLGLCDTLSGHNYKYHIGYCFDGETFMTVHNISLRLIDNLKKLEKLAPKNYHHALSKHVNFMQKL